MDDNWRDAIEADQQKAMRERDVFPQTPRDL